MDKKEEERHYLEKFLAKSKLLVNNIHEGETPDFIVELDNKKISIEITRLILGKQKSREEHLKKLKERLLNKLNQDYPGKGIRITLFFNGYNFLPKKYFTDKEFEKIWQQLDVNNNFSKEKTSTFFIDSQIFSQVKIDENYDENKNNIETPYAYKVPNIEAKLLNDSITKKSNDIKRYSIIPSSKWLLIISNIFDKSSAFGFDTTNLTIAMNDFDKIFIYRYERDEIIELK